MTSGIEKERIRSLFLIHAEWKKFVKKFMNEAQETINCTLEEVILFFFLGKLNESCHF